MNIAILHYHLNRGGVTQVIRNHLRSLASVAADEDECRTAIFFGSRQQDWKDDPALEANSHPLRLCPIPSLDYESRPVDNADALANALRKQLNQLGFTPDETVLHVHNHSVGKNASLPGALRILAQEGYGLLLQIHDFAEDFRPGNYRLLSEALGHDQLSSTLYPQAAQIHYAVLNRRDYSILKSAGIDESRLHFLPNPVPLSDTRADRDAAKHKLEQRFGISPERQYALYPVRGIRRKNLGETLLWSLLARETTSVGITLAPINPAEQKRYAHWKHVASELDLPCYFETGEQNGLTFAENLAASDLILTTSVAEGFGMVFLESWLADRMLVGRNLPEITPDFIEAGVRFDSVYDRFDIPVEWVGRDRYAELFRDCYQSILKDYEIPSVLNGELQSILEKKLPGNLIDFADLDEPLQEQVIRKVAEDPGARATLREHNPALSLEQPSDSQIISQNKQQIETKYSLIPSGTRLRTIYQSVTSSPRDSDFSVLKENGKIIQSFLNPARIRLIRS